MSLTRTSIHDAYGGYVGASAILRDITERKRLVEQLIQAESLAAVGELAAQVAHEIKNPLAGISAAIQLLADGAPSEGPRAGLFSEILDHIGRLDQTVRSLLEFTKPYQPEKQRVPLDLLLDSALSMLEVRPPERSYEIRREISPKADHLDVDPQLFIQVFQNLVLNASHALTGDRDVHVRSRREQDSALIEVEDRGTGMTPETLERIFKPFFTTKNHGTGLGLPIAKKIVEAHGGTIAADSEPGRGTRITIRLPA